MVIATMTVPTLARVSDMSAMASMIAGIDISPSEMRITTGSSQRMVPPSRPMAVPSRAEMAATLAPIRMETRPP